MAITLFKDTTDSVQHLIGSIARGEVALPDIQRPFVWPASKVRDLLDSMYKGFPVGYLLFWETDAEPGARQIGGKNDSPAARLLIVDGQQRLTSLFAVMTGREVVREDYTSGRIRIAFRPTDATFAVTDIAIERDPEFIPDISALWASSNRRNVERTYLKGISAKRGKLDEAEEDRLVSAIDRLYDLHNYPFRIMELSRTVEEEQVAEVFVRINSEGVTLNQADFILTLMSVFWDKGRRQLEDFSRECKLPSATTKASPFNWYIKPSPAQLLRVTVAVAFRRAVLRLVYSLVRGKDLETGRVDSARRESQFARLQAAQEHVLNLTNWHEYLLCLERAGFRGDKMITSENTVLFSYALWLIGRVHYNVPLHRLREVIARWFFMAQTTGRYTGSFETRFEQDAALVTEAGESDGAAGFCRALDRVVHDTLGHDYWTITLPNELATSAAKSPALMAYFAALNILDAEALLSTVKVRSRLDPAVTTVKGIERHHLFPRAYLRKQGVTERKRVNQIANMALVEWSDNIDISATPPAEYWPTQITTKKVGPDRLERQRYWHALPDNWEHLGYEDFLDARRRLMGQVVRDAFDRLADREYAPTYPPPEPVRQATKTSYDVTIANLIDADLLPAGTTLLGAGGTEMTAQVLPDGRIAFNNKTYDTPSAASIDADGSRNGWNHWVADLADGRFRLSSLRERYLSSTAE